MFPKTVYLAISFLASFLIPVWPILALGWDDVTHAVSIYGPLVFFWFIIIGLANRKANQMAMDEQRKKTEHAQAEANRQLQTQRIEAETVASNLRRDLEATIRSQERRNRILVGANRELRTLIGRAMEHGDALTRWVSVLEEKVGSAFSDAHRPALTHAVSALDLAAVFDEQSSGEQTADDEEGRR